MGKPKFTSGDQITYIKGVLASNNAMESKLAFRKFYLYKVKSDDVRLLFMFGGWWDILMSHRHPKYENVMSIDLPAIRSSEVYEISAENKSSLNKLYRDIAEVYDLSDDMLLFYSDMSERLYKYLMRLGLKTPRDLVNLYKAGGLGDSLKIDAEMILSNDCINNMIPADEEALFASEIEKLPDLVDKRKYRYLRIARDITVPESVLEKVGRRVPIRYNGDITAVIDKMERTNKYDSEEIEFLRDYVVFGMDCTRMYTLPRGRCIELVGDLRLNM